jgi:ribosomal protein L19E
MEVSMSVATHDTALGKRKGGKGRRKGLASLKALRRALARRRLEEMREEEALKAQIYDVLADE